MADISTELQAIQNAKYGREVRGSIYQALAAMASELTDFDGNTLMNTHTLITNSNKADICEGDFDFLPENKIYKVSYTATIEHNPFQGYISYIMGIARTSGGYAQGDYQIAYSHNRSKMRTYGTSSWGDWVEAPNDDNLVSLDTTLMTRTRATSLGYNTIFDLPPNHTYRLDATLGDTFELPDTNTAGAAAMIVRPAGTEASSSAVTFYIVAMNKKLFYVSNVSRTDGWRSFPLLFDSEELFMCYTTPITSAIAAEQGWDSVYDLPPMKSYRIGNNVGRFDLPAANNLGASVWVYRTAGEHGSATSITATFYFVAQAGEFWYSYKSGSTISPWKCMTSGGGGGSGLPERTYVAFGASTVDPDSAGKKYPFYVGNMGNFSVTNLAVGGTDFISRLARESSGGTVTSYWLDNVMDMLTSSDNRDVLSDADLITVNVGANDYTMYVKSEFAENPDYEHTHIGQPDDYFDYEDWRANGTYDTIAKQRTPAAQQELRALCTKAGAANFIVRYCSKNFPKAQLMFVISPPSSGFTKHAVETTNYRYYRAKVYTLTDGGTTETLTYTPKVKTEYIQGGNREMLFPDNPHAKGWYERTAANTYSVTSDTAPSHSKTYYTRSGTSPNYVYTEVCIINYGKCYGELVNDMMRQLCANAKVPLIDCSDMFTTVHTNAGDKYRDDSAGHSGVHPTAEAYEQYGKPVAAAILAKYRN